MTHRERIQTIIAGEAADRCGFWLGDPHPDTWPLFLKHFNAPDEETLRRALCDDFRWICPQFFPTAYRHPDGAQMFDEGLNKERHGVAGPFADCEDVK